VNISVIYGQNQFGLPSVSIQVKELEKSLAKKWLAATVIPSV
jgi:hypothetical protein